MQYYFVAGRYPELSYAEISQIYKIYFPNATISKYSSDIFVINGDGNVSELFDRLGGFLEYGEIIEDLDGFLEKYSDREKVVFGINFHIDVTDQEIVELYANIKNWFKEKGISAKYPTSDNKILSSSIIEGNKILENGFLLDIFNNKSTSVYGRCISVQDVSKFELVEYKKPYTDKRMGVLPAKLARIMVNLSGARPGQTIWDPFCGSGTVLLEAFGMGVNSLGSDINIRALDMCNANIEWFAKELGDNKTKYKTFPLDITKFNSKIMGLLKKTDIEAIVCEPFMGPPQLERTSYFQAKKNLSRVKELYLSLFSVLDRIGKRDLTVVMIVPSYKTKNGWLTISVNEICGKRWNIENKKYGGDLHWERENSIIRRNIFILKRKLINKK